MTGASLLLGLLLGSKALILILILILQVTSLSFLIFLGNDEVLRGGFLLGLSRSEALRL